jgi:hypothetical protein
VFARLLQALRRVLAGELDLEDLSKHYRRNRRDSFNGPEVENADVLSKLPDLEVAIGKPEGREAEIRQAADFIVHMRVWFFVWILSRFHRVYFFPLAIPSETVCVCVMIQVRECHYLKNQILRLYICLDNVRGESGMQLDAEAGRASRMHGTCD